MLPKKVHIFVLKKLLIFWVTTVDFYRLKRQTVQNHSKPCFLESPDPGYKFGYLHYGEKIQIENFKRVFSKKHVKKRSWRVSGGVGCLQKNKPKI